LTSRPIISDYHVRIRTDSPPYYFAILLGEQISAALFLALLSPALLIVAAVVYAISGRSPLVADRRVGKNGHSFPMLKLRTMWPAGGHRPRQFRWIEYLQEQPARELKTAGDPRVTSSFAAFCRRHSIDELPQLWHVINGTMSYVGPRPVTADELREHYGIDACEVLAHRPGLSGLWQVTGRSRLSYRQRKRLDLYLVRHLSLALYLGILRRTAACVVKGKSAW
jgi:exopolysaccharide production protein ExoY